MTQKDIEILLNLAKNSGLNALVYGNSGIGKTSFCQALFVKSAVVLPVELNENNLVYLKSVFEAKEIIIFENIGKKELDFLRPILTNRVLFSKNLNNFFIITSTEKHFLPKTLPILFEAPSTLSWLDWAKENKINPSLVEAIKNQDLLKLHTPQTLESLSRLLNQNIPKHLLEGILEEFLATDKSSISTIKNDYKLTKNSQNSQNMQNPYLQNKLDPKTKNSLEALVQMLDDKTQEENLLNALNEQAIKTLIDNAINDIKGLS